MFSEQLCRLFREDGERADQSHLDIIDRAHRYVFLLDSYGEKNDEDRRQDNPLPCTRMDSRWPSVSLNSALSGGEIDPAPPRSPLSSSAPHHACEPDLHRPRSAPSALHACRFHHFAAIDDEEEIGVAQVSTDGERWRSSSALASASPALPGSRSSVSVSSEAVASSRISIFGS